MHTKTVQNIELEEYYLHYSPITDILIKWQNIKIFS